MREYSLSLMQVLPRQQALQARWHVFRDRSDLARGIVLQRVRSDFLELARAKPASCAHKQASDFFRRACLLGHANPPFRLSTLCHIRGSARSGTGATPFPLGSLNI